ncbi:3-chlorobenzoate-3,4-dioxygenase reductase subunit [Hyaloscypha bicolor E]|uniref:3-chlorobenzoate-3,4-dioxygenase reductase subunit n=1 Tax=Hyaloscypha bicolor E TaxID=1095630 RepID=A0A2J6TLG5_9HELO|nr:3-chlorobenzoate-3,4-dioxygenase reductase subunit [Hyaloscypha bicolor E]PMD63846.1 3-chlorobenzoate-3,4-dioxygenase reductase subunit [Hyaloscypha bicolor E]
MATQTPAQDAPEASAQPIDKLLQVRTGKLRPVFGLKTPSGIFKTVHQNPVKVEFLGCEGDEHGYIGHGGVDKALMWYPSQHYAFWKTELPQNAHLFGVGGFGENIVTSNEKLSEKEVCVGDMFRFGREEAGVVIQISEPRQPCFMLNHRLEVKDMSIRSQNANRTGWYCRVLKEGHIQSGDPITLVERKYPKWTVKAVQTILYVERKNWEAIRELSELSELGEEIRMIFLNRLKKGIFLDESDRLGGGEDKAWNEYRLVGKKVETPRICSFEFETINTIENSAPATPGSHIRVKFGGNSQVVRAYSIVGGDSDRFTLGIALDRDSRGGSRYLHEELKIGDTLSFSQMKSDFSPAVDADHHILIAGGVGITAFLITARQLRQQGQNFHLYYAIRSAHDVAFKHLVQELGNDVTVLDGSKGQRLEISKIIAKSNSRTHIYCCGPQRLMDGVTLAARTLSFPSSNLHFEAFTALASGDPFTVELAESKKTLDIKAEQTLLDVLRDSGFDIPSSCEVGNCGTCRVGVRGGKVEHRGTGLLEGEKKGAMLSCVSRGIGRVVLDL